MTRLLQSGFGVGLLVLLVVIGAVNTAQLHNLEKKVAELETSPRPTVSGQKEGPPVAVVSTAQAGGSLCYSSDEEKLALQDEANVLKPFQYPPGWPSKIDRGGTLKRHVGQDPPGLNPIASNNAADLSELYRYMGARIAVQSQHNPDDWYPDLATKVTRSPDGLVYDVYLRKGAYWSKPTVDLSDPRHAWLAADHEVTADDYAFTIEMIKNPQVLGRAAALRTYVEALSRIEVVDTHHFRVHFTENLYINQPTLLDLEPMPRWLYMYDEDGRKFDDATWGDKQNSHWYNQKAIGAGAYNFVEWEPGVRIVIEKNERYHLNKCAPANFDRIEMKVLKDQQSWLRRLKTGELDYSHMQPQQFLAEVKDKQPYLGEEGLKLAVGDEASYFYIGWNQTRPQFQDKRVRKALSEALDRQGLVDSVFAGLGTITSGPFDQSNPCYDSSIAPLPYDLEDAKRLLDEAGWKDTDGDGTRDKMVDGKKVQFTFTMVIYGSSTEYETLARVYREALDRLGIKMTAQPLEWAAHLKKINERDFDAYTGAWVPSWEIDLYQIWHSTEADRPESSNYVSFRNADGDRIAEALRREFDETKRVDLCHQFHALVHDEQPYTFIYQRKRPVLYWDHMNTPIFSKLNPHRDARLFSFASLPDPAK
ncbi:MAG: ABC transporter substrate-binding protein [Pseudomonadota bacterium]|nr:ABC transporter substrate-binding protein [Pseudomonadota bacterium]